MKEKYIHIVSFDVPLPADYGGVIDVFYKIVWLHRQGIKIYLHCFTKGRAEQTELEKYCQKVFYYKRQTGLKGISLRLPYIVSSRRSKALLTNLQKDNYPVLFEGIHTTYWLYKNKLSARQMFVRLHNVENKYYKQLANNEGNFFKRLYFTVEAAALEKYENIIAKKAILLPMSTADATVYKNEFSALQMNNLSVFTPWSKIESLVGSGAFCMYHGNLAINENELAALWLVQHVFAFLQTQFIIAGKGSSRRLYKAVKKFPHISVVNSPSDADLEALLQQAHINILPSFNDTGVKLKLLNALYNGRHCVVNAAALSGSGLEEICLVASGEAEFKDTIKRLMLQPFTGEAKAHRTAVLNERYNNEKNATVLSALIQ